MKLSTTIVMGVLALLMTAATAQEPSRVMEKGSIYDGPSQAAAMVARNADEFRRMIKLFGTGRLPPKPDFGQYLVAAVSMGQRPTGGYAVTILGTEEREGTLYIRYRERIPRRGEIVTQALTSPYHAKFLSASTTEKVLFEKVCEPEIHKPD